MAGRILAIGDIHGCLPALETVLEGLAPQPDDTIVTLGDYVDRGPDSRGVIERLLAVGRECRLVPLMGNHDEMMIAICNGINDLLFEWLFYGGDATVRSYDGAVPGGVPPEHIAFLKGCRNVFELDRWFFVHGYYVPDLPLDQQPEKVLRWESLKYTQPRPHCSGKTAIVGHTAQKSGKVLDLGFLKCIDTWCYGEGCLTALDLDSGQTWQADKQGKAKKRKR
jgi:serine/threonine protein phosphatase 1